MHDASCIGMNYAHRFPKCFRSLGLFALHFVSPIKNCCHCTKFVQFLTCTRTPCRDSHCENGLVRCCLYNSETIMLCSVIGLSGMVLFQPAPRILSVSAVAFTNRCGHCSAVKLNENQSDVLGSFFSKQHQPPIDTRPDKRLNWKLGSNSGCVAELLGPVLVYLRGPWASCVMNDDATDGSADPSISSLLAKIRPQSVRMSCILRERNAP